MDNRITSSEDRMRVGAGQPDHLMETEHGVPREIATDRGTEFMSETLKQVLNIVILVLYRTGYNGEFLGVGGTWNLNEEKNPDAEIVASGVIVGYLIYTLAQVVTYLFGTTEHKRAMSEIVMNFVGVFLWIAVGAVALHYWGGYQGEHQYQFVFAEKQVGLAVGALCVINGAVYLLDTALSVIHFTKEM